MRELDFSVLLNLGMGGVSICVNGLRDELRRSECELPISSDGGTEWQGYRSKLPMTLRICSAEESATMLRTMTDWAIDHGLLDH